jgi:glycosyltransferase involved in cell wall biosynthesis
VSERWILQFCHCHYGPFLDVARQTATLFKGSAYKVLTVYLTGKPSETARVGSASDEVIFLDYASKQVRGLKLSAILALRKIAASRDCVLVIAHRAKPIYIACLATSLPVIGVQHSFGDYQRASRRWFANRFRQRLSLLGVSNAVRDDMRRYLPKWPADRIETLHNRIDVAASVDSILPKQEARARLGLPENAKIIGNVGRLHPDKDQKTLLVGFAQALPHLPPGALLAIAGSGRLEADLKAQAQAEGSAERVIFLGQVPEIRRLFAAFDLFVLSSDREPFGMVLLEAMAANVPIIATDCGGAPEIVADDHALFPLGNSQALAGKLTAFFSTPPAGEVPLARLKERFSDEAARRRFFALPMVHKVLGP